MMKPKVHYNEFGYCIIPNVLSPADCEAIIKVAKRQANAQFAPIIDLEKKVDYLEEVIINDPIILGLVQEVLVNPFRCIGTMFHFKAPGSPYAQQAWQPHQDNSYIKAKPGTFLSAILALVDANQDNGGMYCYPRSHHEPVLPYTPNPSFGTATPGNIIDAKYYQKYEKEDLTMKQGSLYLQSGELIHGSYPNCSNRSREMISLMYLDLNEKYEPKGLRKDTSLVMKDIWESPFDS